jgi:hypothetical protein
MAVCTRTSLIATGLIAALAACGGDDDGGVTVIDAPAIDAPIDAAIDAPPVCNAPNMVCGGECTDVTSNEQYCGDCNTACPGGEVCTTSTCACAPAFVPANPQGLFTMMFEQLGLSIGISVYGASTTNILLGGISVANTEENTPYTVSPDVGTPPFIAAGYNVDLGTQTADAAYYATAGTLTFTKICPPSSPGGAGYSGTLTNATFSAVEGLTNPVIVQDGCTFDVASVTFSFGDVSCTNQ